MIRSTFLFSMVLIMLAGCVPIAPVAPVVIDQAKSITPCAVTEPHDDEPPDDPNADPFGFGPWVINADRTIWVGLPPGGAWRTGGEKVIWIRPAGTELTISGHRLDGDAPPLRAAIPCCYLTGFQVTGLHFPSEGCWAVTATAGEHELHFVTQVGPADGPVLSSRR
jgi:hypothetical protein